ncbi:MAG TPA: alpha/beta hydrolase-fold protein [Gemmatimonadales bacterium]|nr:alpha/beta hydrolase-fold protein [Gemmatimonadales bacterium]
MTRIRTGFTLLALMLAGTASAQSAVLDREPVTIGESFVLRSAVLGEDRRINVYIPPAWGVPDSTARPVLYMPDGGEGEDFLHVAGLLQVSVMNGSIRPVTLVGIENTERRRDLTGPTTVPGDSAIAPRVGGSALFRRFIREELIPFIENRYPTTAERAIIGESLAGLFVVETLLLEPRLFDHYIAIDPSLWWNGRSLLIRAPDLLRSAAGVQSLFVASSGEPELAADAASFSTLLERHAPPSLSWTYRAMPEETHGTIYHPAALVALRSVLRNPQ